jgi:UDP-N-acetylmuramoyl-L-alanyl-D-glutamate--2,6-diaminopimelate ligase
MSRSLMLSRLIPEIAPERDLAVSGLVMDSREVRPGDAFVAIAGFGSHGLAHAGRALEAGAAVVLFEPPAPAELPAPAGAIGVDKLRDRLGAMADQFHGHPSRAMGMVGVTGTNGKTSTVQLLAQAWHLRGLRSGSIGTLGAGLYGQVQPTGFTTPLVLRMHALLGQLRDEGAQMVAMEVSSHALEQGRVDGVHFDVAVFTNLTRDHLDYHGSMQAYGQAKARLFTRPGLKAAVINLDDAFGQTLPAQLAADVELFGVSSRGAAGARIQAQRVQLDGRGIGFDLVVDGRAYPVRSPLLGRFNVDNLLVVAASLLALGESVPQVAVLLGQLQPVAGRMNRLGGDGHKPLVVIDYAHTPDALEQALASLRAHAGQRLLCVFGCGGDRDRGKRPMMAAIAEAGADLVIVTDDNPRSEDGDAIVADIVAGFGDRAKVAVERDRARAIARAIALAGPQDVVLVAGKGHEPYQEINGVRHDFDDTRVAAALLAGQAPAVEEGA